MSSLALPYRVALVALLAVGALWFTVLRPKPVETPPPTAPGATGLGNAVEGAQSAVQTANAAAQRSADAAVPPPRRPATGTGTAGATPGTAAQRRAPAADDASTPILRQLDRGRVVALLFYNRRGSDDRAVRSALRAVPRRDGRLVVKTSPISRLGRYEAITRGVKVLAAPTVLVIGPGPSARAITGFTTTAEINQAVSEMLELSGGEPAPALEERRARRHARELCGTGATGAGCREYLAQANRICAQMSEDGFARAAVAGAPRPTSRPPSARSARASQPRSRSSRRSSRRRRARRRTPRRAPCCARRSARWTGSSRACPPLPTRRRPSPR